MTIPKQGSHWDEHRNSSRVFPVPPDALPNALRALVQFRTSDPARVKWIEDGYPTLSEDEHYSRFGETYNQSKRR